MLTLTFRNVLRTVTNQNLSKSFSTGKALRKTPAIDPLQEAALNEKCILVDKDDKAIGSATKKECHKVGPDGNIPLHRAFSVFLFNKHGDLLLQKRSAEKVTFPNRYTNSCCSHPIMDFPGETDEKDAIGVRRAAQRRLNYELGLPLESIPVEAFTYLTRVYYKDEGNGQWGEHEIDYVLFLKQTSNVKIDPNPNEISEISWVPRGELDDYIPTLSGRLTPWFDLILKHRLRLWWDNLDNLVQFKDHTKILHFKD